MKFRDVNRYDVYRAISFVLVSCALLFYRASKDCGYSKRGFGDYCGIDETWAWLKAGGGVWFWLMFAVIVVVGVGSLLDRARR